MSIAVMTWVWNHSTTAGTERLMLLAIADNADDHGQNAWPSIATLSRKTRLDERSVRRILRRLEDGNHIKVDTGAGVRGTNRYTILKPPVAGDTPPGQDVPPGNSPPDTNAPRGGSTVRGGGVAAPPKQSFTSSRTSWRASARVTDGGKDKEASPRGAALPASTNAPDRCEVHPGQYKTFCGPCRSEEVGK